MVRWVACGFAAGLACTTPNTRFVIGDDEDLADTSSTAGATSEPNSAGAAEASSDGGDSSDSGDDVTGTTGDPLADTTTGAASTGLDPSTTTTSTSGGDTTTDTSSTTTTGDPGPCAGQCGTPGCGVCPDGAMVPFPGFAIDARETSNAEYQQFVAVTHDMTAQPSACAWNDDFTPQGPLGAPSLPVVGIDWCDAQAYCAWSGKRLCGAISGGPNKFSQLVDATNNQWYRACSNGDGRRYPYGPTYNKLACNGDDFDVNDRVDVGSLPGCEAPVAGIFDLSGNVWEWVDSCNGDGPDAECLRRGGSYFSDADDLRCDLLSKRPRATAVSYVGVRCCSL